MVFGWDDALMIGGSLLGGIWQAETNKGIARDQMAFQRDMSNSAHQRQVSDLRAAGLNPLLSANSGASSPAGAGIGVENPAASAASNYIQFKAMKGAVAKQDADIGYTNALTSKVDKEKKLVDAQIEATHATARDILSTIDAKEAHGKIDSKLAPLDAVGKRVNEYLMNNSRPRLMRPLKDVPIKGQDNYIKRNQGPDYGNR